MVIAQAVGIHDKTNVFWRQSCQLFDYAVFIIIGRHDQDKSIHSNNWDKDICQTACQNKYIVDIITHKQHTTEQGPLAIYCAVPYLYFYGQHKHPHFLQRLCISRLIWFLFIYLFFYGFDVSIDGIDRDYGRDATVSREYWSERRCRSGLCINGFYSEGLFWVRWSWRHERRFCEFYGAKMERNITPPAVYWMPHCPQ